MPAPPPRRIVQALLGTPKGGRLPAGLLGSQGALSKYTPTMREKIAGLLAKNWYGDSREGYRKAERLVNVGETVAPPLGLMTGMYDAGRAAGGGNMMQAGLIGGMAALPLPPAIKKGIRAYHGSPHSFDKFSMDKIGTGEGAQVYGHGLYFAEEEATGKAYRDALSSMGDSVRVKTKYSDARIPINLHDGKGNAFDYETWSAAKIAARHKGNLKAALAEIGDNRLYTKEKPILEKWRNDGAKVSIDGANPGHMYEVNIDADPDQFLDWDKPLSEQPENVRNAVLPMLDNSGNAGASRAEIFADFDAGKISLAERNARLGHLLPGVSDNTSGAVIYNRLAGTGRANTAPLQQAGIPGIKYLDAGSRARGDGSRNYVVFDENLISIVRKYGIAGASTLLGYDLLSNVTTDQAEKLKQAERVY